MALHPAPRLSRPGAPPALTGAAVAALCVAAVTALIYPLRQVSPTASDAIVYLLPVLLVSTVWGLWLGLATSLAGALAFNFFHLPPVGELTIADPRNWVALGVFLVVAVVASSLAEVAQARRGEAEQGRRDADLTAELARILLGGGDVASTLPTVAHRLAQALELPSIAVEPGDAPNRRAARVPAPRGRAPGGDRARAGRHERERERAPDPAPSARPGSTAGRRPGAPAAAGRGGGGRGAAPQRRDQDRAAAHGLARPAHAADRDRHRRRRPRRARRVRRGASRAGRGDHRRRRQARGPRGQAARPVATAGRSGAAAARVVLGRGARRRGGRRPAGRAGALRPGARPRPPAHRGRRGPARARAGQPAGERRSLLGRASGLRPGARRGAAAGHPRRRSRARNRRGGAAADLRGVLPVAVRSRRAHRIGARVGDRQGLRRANGGRVWAESLPAQGTSFVVELPLPEHAPAAAETTAGNRSPA